MYDVAAVAVDVGVGVHPTVVRVVGPIPRPAVIPTSTGAKPVLVASSDE